MRPYVVRVIEGTKETTYYPNADSAREACALTMREHCATFRPQAGEDDDFFAVWCRPRARAEAAAAPEHADARD